MHKDKIIEKATNIKGLGGMTVNERLYASGLIDLFDQSKSEDKQTARFILIALKVDEDSIKKVLG
jgi:hypothetical protein